MAIPTLEEIEKLNKKAQEYRALETAIDRLDRAMLPQHQTIITAIVAHDNANGHRDIDLEFAVEDGLAIFEAAKRVLTARLSGLKADLGIEEGGGTMALTLDQAVHAGALAREVQTLQANIPLLQAAIAGHVQLTSMQASTTGGDLSLSDMLSDSDTQMLLGGILTVAQNRVAAITAELATM